MLCDSQPTNTTDMLPVGWLLNARVIPISANAIPTISSWYPTHPMQLVLIDKLRKNEAD
jgi:hypothetical protein